MTLHPMAVSATLHCLTGCAIGEVLGMVIGTTLGFSTIATVALAVTLAFIFGFALSLWALLRSHVNFKLALGTVLAADTISITVMEIVDNAVMLAIPGAIHSGVMSWLFWLSLAFALAVAFAAALPVNSYLLKRGKGHALMHQHHHH